MGLDYDIWVGPYIRLKDPVDPDDDDVYEILDGDILVEFGGARGNDGVILVIPNQYRNDKDPKYQRNNDWFLIDAKHVETGERQLINPLDVDIVNADNNYDIVNREMMWLTNNYHEEIELLKEAFGNVEVCWGVLHGVW
jgi:hypothetical protein